MSALNAYKESIKVGCGTLDVIINYLEEGKPIRMEAHLELDEKAAGCTCFPSMLAPVCELVSLNLRNKVRPKEIIDQLYGVECHNVGVDGKKYVESCLDAIAQVLQHYMDHYQK